MTMISCCVGACPLPAGGSVVTICVLTTCWGDDWSLSLIFACRRSRCTDANTSLCCVANSCAPSCCSQDRFPFMVASTTGNGTRDFTLASQGCASNAFAKASPARDLCVGSSTHRAAATTSRGKVEAINNWVSNSSGYRAIGASNASSCSELNGWAAVGCAGTVLGGV